MNKNYVSITADDYGLSENINRGIFESVNAGPVTSVSLLINAPATHSALNNIPNAEIGLHLSLVEGFCLSGKTSLISRHDYFPGNICLYQNWKEFLYNFCKGQIPFEDIDIELRTQCREFKKNFDRIPFINLSQHLQLIPGIWPILKSIMLDYNILCLRLPLAPPEKLLHSFFSPEMVGLWTLGQIKKIQDDLSHTNDYCLGIAETGTKRLSGILNCLDRMQNKRIEILVHPGIHDSFLADKLSANYVDFLWEEELELVQKLLPAQLLHRNIKLMKFSEMVFKGTRA